MLQGIAESSAPVSRSFIEGSLNQYRVWEQSSESKRTKGAPPAASKKASKTDVEKFKQQLAQKDAEISKKKADLEAKKREIQDLQKSLADRNKAIIDRGKAISELTAQKLEAEAKFSAADTEAADLREKWTAAIEVAKARQREAEAVNEKMAGIYNLVIAIGEKSDLSFDVAMTQARMGDDRVGEEIMGVRRLSRPRPAQLWTWRQS